MHDEQVAEPDDTAVRVALWRAFHVQVDAPPPVFVDEVGLRLVAPDDEWHGRPDMGRQRLIDLGLGIPSSLRLVPVDFEAAGIERAAAGARASGTPFISFFTPTEMLALGRDAGLREVRHVSAATLAQRYFTDRTDGLRPPNNSEELLVPTT